MANLSNINNKFIVEDSGDVGIGVTAATSKLHLRDPGVNSDVGIKIGNDSRDWNLQVMGSVSDSFQIFTHDNSNVMTILPSGNVGIGISPSKKLTVFGTGAGNATVQIEGEGGADPYINFLANNVQHWSLGIDDSDSDKFKLSEHSALGTNDYFVVDTSGNVGIGTTSPDYGKLQIDTASGNNLTIRKGTGSPAIAFGGVTNNEATFLLEGNPSASGFKIYNGSGTLASPTWTAGMDFYDGGRLHPYGGVFLGSSNNSNLLNYYASGTWTPTVTSSAGGGFPAYSSIGYFQRVGKVVTASFEFTISNLGTASGTVIINNLPLAIASGNGVKTVVGYGNIAVLGQSLSIYHYTALNQIGMNKYDGSFAGTTSTTRGTVTYWAEL